MTQNVQFLFKQNHRHAASVLFFEPQFYRLLKQFFHVLSSVKFYHFFKSNKLLNVDSIHNLNWNDVFRFKVFSVYKHSRACVVLQQGGCSEMHRPSGPKQHALLPCQSRAVLALFANAKLEKNRRMCTVWEAILGGKDAGKGKVVPHIYISKLTTLILQFKMKLLCQFRRKKN